MTDDEKFDKAGIDPTDAVEIEWIATRIVEHLEIAFEGMRFLEAYLYVSSTDQDVAKSIMEDLIDAASFDFKTFVEGRKYEDERTRADIPAFRRFKRKTIALVEENVPQMAAMTLAIRDVSNEDIESIARVTEFIQLLAEKNYNVPEAQAAMEFNEN